MADTDLQLNTKAVLQLETSQQFFNLFEYSNYTEGSEQQNDTLNYSHFRNPQAVTLNKGAFIACIRDRAAYCTFIDCKYQMLTWLFHYI